MGFMDFVKSIFGIGGCSVELALDAAQVPVGGVLAGTATVVGADKEYPLTSISVKLLYVLVESVEGSALPKIDTRIMIDNTLANNAVIPANGKLTFPFTLQIPGGTEPSAHNVSYTVLVAADIPGLKDPSAKKDLKVVEAEEGSSTLSLDAMYHRWPALRGAAEGPLCDALRDVGYSHSDWDEANNLGSMEPVIARFLKHESESVRSAALETWSRLIGDNPTAANVATLAAVLKDAKPEANDTMEAIEAAARFRKVGGLALLEPLAKHPSAAVRSRVAWSIGVHGSDVGKGLMLLQTMLNDADLEVRVKVVEAIAAFSENGVVMKALASMALDPATPIALRRALPYSLMRGWNFQDVVWPGLAHLSRDEDHDVRRKVASVVTGYTASAGAMDVMTALLADEDPEVRREMAYQVRNCPEDAVAPLRPRLMALAQDADRDVRTSAIGSLPRGMEVDEVVSLYRGWMSTDPSEPVLRGIVQGIKYEMEPQYKAILNELTSSAYPDVAREAKDGFAYSVN